MNHRVPAAILVLALLGAACSRGDDPVLPIAQAEKATTTTQRATTSSAKPAPSTTTSSTVPPPPAHPTWRVMEPAASPADLAQRLVAAETAIADPATPPADLPRWGHAQQIAYRQLVQRPEWHQQVRDAVPASLRPSFEAHLWAGHRLRSMITEPKEELPRWTIVAPLSPDELLGHYRAAEAEFGVPWPYLAAINLVETRMGRIRGLSSAGAQGPMQFMPATWAAYGEGDVNDAGDAIRAAARYLAANGAPADMPNALWNYNHSPRYVDAVTAHAERMATSEAAYRAYWGWQVYYVTVAGDVWLPEGWVHPEGANA